MRDQVRLRHDSIRAETTCVDWIRRYVVFHGKRHPRDLDAAQAQEFLRGWRHRSSMAPACGLWQACDCTTQRLASSLTLLIAKPAAAVRVSTPSFS
ncbi:phage integrase N-terminal SAM-like domain-containing protein [Piscinibacter terrae]|uniref:phage integrase N-terminal SAM-like domain-containing protein n=1 Tax=Piscinibacter terrae TaxID=2496871 RepID=UPI0038B236FD